MIYLFNSAYRAKYKRNILNTLFLPSGYTNEYRYRFKGDPHHISSGQYDSLLKARANDPVAIIFIDRFDPEGYVYHPLRLGSITKNYPEDDRLYFRPKLEDYIYPKDLDSFNSLIVNELENFGLPKLTNNEPKSSNDGYYAIIANDLFSHSDKFFHGEDAWVEIVDKLRVTRSLQHFDADEDQHIDPDDEPCETIFIRCRVIKTGKKDSELSPRLRDYDSKFELNPGTRYGLQLIYRYPPQLVNETREAQVEVYFGENLRPLGDNKITVDSYNNVETLPFVTKRFLEEKDDGLNLVYTSSVDNCKVYGPNSRLVFHIKEPVSFWIYLIGLIILFTIINTVIATDFSNIEELSFETLIQEIAWITLALSFLQSWVIFGLFRLVGKSFL